MVVMPRSRQLVVVPTVLGTVKLAAKSLVKLPAAPAVRSSALVLLMPVCHVTRMFVLTGVMAVMPKKEALLVGSVLARNSGRFVIVLFDTIPKAVAAPIDAAS